METRTARVAGIGGTYAKGIVVLTLSDGATVRARSDQTGIVPNCPVDLGVAMAYDVDDAGNRFNARLSDAAEIKGKPGVVRLPVDLTDDETPREHVANALVMLDALRREYDERSAVRNHLDVIGERLRKALAKLDEGAAVWR